MLTTSPRTVAIPTTQAQLILRRVGGCQGGFGGRMGECGGRLGGCGGGCSLVDKWVIWLGCAPPAFSLHCQQVHAGG